MLPKQVLGKLVLGAGLLGMHPRRARVREEPVAETEALETEALETEALETEALETEALETEALETEALETEALETEALETEALETEARRRGTRSALPAAVAASIAGVIMSIVVSGCATEPGTNARQSSRAESSPANHLNDTTPATQPPAVATTTPMTATNLEGELTDEDRVVEAYRRLWIEIVAANDPPDPDSPKLAEVATGEMLDKIREQTRAAKAAGTSIKQSSPSRFRFTPTSVTIAGDRADLEGCLFEDFVRTRTSDGSQLPTQPVSRRASAHLTHANGSWRTEKNQFTENFPGRDTCGE